MPVMVFYKDKSIEPEAAQEVMEALANVTSAELDAKIEVRVVEPVLSFNANKVHVEMRFRDFGEYTDKMLEEYHTKAMAAIGAALKKHNVACQYSFYIVPSMPPRSLWAQGKPQ